MIKVFDDDKILAKKLAQEILLELKKKKRLVLGCPGGRSLKKTYYYLLIRRLDLQEYLHLMRR